VSIYAYQDNALNVKMYIFVHKYEPKNRLMRKLLLLVGLFVATFAYSQTPLTTAVDFTATDFNGNEFTLFEILDGGQYVVIDFFGTG